MVCDPTFELIPRMDRLSCLSPPAVEKLRPGTMRVRSSIVIDMMFGNLRAIDD